MFDTPAPPVSRQSQIGAPERILSNAQVVMADRVVRGCVVMRGGVIADIDGAGTAVPAAIDMDGDYLIPGLVDIHTDNLEKHIEPRPGVHWPTLAALSGHDRQIATAGITSVLDSLYVAGAENPKDKGRADALVTAVEALEIAQADGLMMAEHFLHLRCELGWAATPDFLAAHIHSPMVRLVSVMDHTPGQRQWRDVEKWRRFNSRKFAPDELDAIMASRQADHETFAVRNRRAVVRLCQDGHLPIASHDDTTVAHVEEAAADGIAISEFPCTLEAARLAKDRGMSIVMGAPNVVLGGSHSGNVAAHVLAENGLLDGLASDYVPVSMVEGAFLLHDRHGMALPDAIAAVTRNPARMVGLDDRGEIAPGLRADVVRVHPYHRMPIVRSVWRAGQRIV